MSNGDSWTAINEMRRDVSDIKANGCAHRAMQDQAVRDLRADLKEVEVDVMVAKKDIWGAIDREREAREGMINKIVLGVLAIVVGGVILNMVTLSYIMPRLIAAAK